MWKSRKSSTEPLANLSNRFPAIPPASKDKAISFILFPSDSFLKNIIKRVNADAAKIVRRSGYSENFPHAAPLFLSKTKLKKAGMTTILRLICVTTMIFDAWSHMKTRKAMFMGEKKSIVDFFSIGDGVFCEEL
jgi:hypothetical protein